MLYRYGRLAVSIALVMAVTALWGCRNKALEWDPSAQPPGDDPGLGGGDPIPGPQPITRAQLLGVWKGEYISSYDIGTDSATTVSRKIEISFGDSTYSWKQERRPREGEGSYILKPDSLKLTNDSPYQWIYEKSSYLEAPNYTHLFFQDTLRLRWDGEAPEFRKEAVLVRKSTAE